MTTQNHYYSGQGSLFTAERDANGKAKGFTRVGNVPELSLDIEVSKKEHKESESGKRLLDNTLITETKGKFKFKLENLTLDNLALGLYGVSSTVATGNITGEVIKAYKGKKVALAHPDVSAVVVKDSTDTTTYVLNTDYTLDAKNGGITILTGSAIVEAADLHVNYTHAEYGNMEAFTSSTSPERFLRFEGLNTVDGSYVIIDIFRGQFDPLTGYGLLSDDIASIDMAGSVLADANITSGSQFFRQRNVAA